MSEMIERVAWAIFSDRYPGEDWKEYQKRDYCGHARAAIEAMRELPEEPGPRYTAGEYSRRSQAAMVDDAALLERP